jgi:hypothetical protein
MLRLACLTAAALAAALPNAAQARMADDDPFAGFETLDIAEMGGMRGGMMIGGIPVDFAVVIKTTVEGALAANGLQTTIAVNDQGGVGAVTTTTIGSQGVATNTEGGMSLSLDGGATAILHQVVDGQVRAMLANTVDARSITHQTQINVTMPGFESMAQSHFAYSHTASRTSDALMVALGRF